MKYLLVLFTLLVSTTASSEALSPRTVASGLGVPWGMAILPDNHMLITQRQGNLSLLDLNTLKLTNIDGLPAIKVGGQGGLFDVALPPNYPENKWIYFSYAKEVDGQAATSLARAKLDKKTLTNWQDLIITQSRSSKSAHFGGRITFDDSGHVFLSIGDRGVRAKAQDTSNHAGSILRLNLDGSVPDDNPFVGKASVLDEIWSYGHRNPQGLFFNKQTQQLWAIEHGPRGGDEINLIEPTKNYGWPVISYGKEYWAPLAVGEGTEKTGMEQPIQTYIPSIAPSSLIQYSGKIFKDWQGDLLATAMALKHLNRITLNDDNSVKDEQRYLQNQNARLRNVIESHEGWLYISTDNGDIIQVTPAQ